MAAAASSNSSRSVFILCLSLWLGVGMNLVLRSNELLRPCKQPKLFCWVYLYTMDESLVAEVLADAAVDRPAYIRNRNMQLE